MAKVPATAYGLEHGHGRGNGLQSLIVQIDQQHFFVPVQFVKPQGDGRAAVANVLQPTHFLRLVDVAQGNVVRRRKALVGKASSAPT